MTEITTPWIPSPANVRTGGRSTRRTTRERARRTTRRHAGAADPIRWLARRLTDHVPTSATPSDRALAGIGHIERHLR